MQSLIASSLTRCALPMWYERSFPSLIIRYRVGMDTPMVRAAYRSDGGWSLTLGMNVGPHSRIFGRGRKKAGCFDVHLN